MYEFWKEETESGERIGERAGKPRKGLVAGSDAEPSVHRGVEEVAHHLEEPWPLADAPAAAGATAPSEPISDAGFDWKSHLARRAMLDAVAHASTHASTRSGSDGGPHAMQPDSESLESVFIAIYEHRYGLDISAHASRDAATTALIDTARSQCARDPEIREAVTARYGTWPAGDMTREELEKLVGEWNDLAPSEALWIAECTIEDKALEARRRAFTTPPE